MKENTVKTYEFTLGELKQRLDNTTTDVMRDTFDKEALIEYVKTRPNALQKTLGCVLNDIDSIYTLPSCCYETLDEIINAVLENPICHLPELCEVHDKDNTSEWVLVVRQDCPGNDNRGYIIATRTKAQVLENY